MDVTVARIAQFAPDMLDVVVHLGDECRSDAMKEAEELLNIMGIAGCTHAYLGADGLVLVFDTDNVGLRAWHFEKLVAGYPGCVPRAAADILSMFGFGDSEEIFGTISTGGSTVHFVFTKRA